MNVILNIVMLILVLPSVFIMLTTPISILTRVHGAYKYMNITTNHIFYINFTNRVWSQVSAKWIPSHWKWIA